MIDLTPEHLCKVVEILRQHLSQCEVRVFGSRVTGKATTYSDLDLALVAEQSLDWRQLEALKEAFAESDLPIMVDILDWQSISPEFRRVIEAEYELIEVNRL
ncbi:MAG: nucleotidyltransferase domain-containing protein [Desulfuromusa sp.]|nr:nucleotidyltransferase domain-containing protein [Desulfuromusa sp.]